MPEAGAVPARGCPRFPGGAFIRRFDRHRRAVARHGPAAHILRPAHRGAPHRPAPGARRANDTFVPHCRAFRTRPSMAAPAPPLAVHRSGPTFRTAFPALATGFVRAIDRQQHVVEHVAVLDRERPDEAGTKALEFPLRDQGDGYDILPHQSSLRSARAAFQPVSHVFRAIAPPPQRLPSVVGARHRGRGSNPLPHSLRSDGCGRDPVRQPLSWSLPYLSPILQHRTQESLPCSICYGCSVHPRWPLRHAGGVSAAP